MRRLLLSYFLMVFALLIFNSAYPCSRALWNSSKGVFVGRNMDWVEDMGSNLHIYPRGMWKDGGASDNSLQWTSKYASVVTDAYNALTTDGMNEKGLAAHILWLAGSDYGTRNTDLPGLSVLLWSQYYLDNFSTVDEAVRETQAHPYQIQTLELADGPMSIHVALEDATGDSAILEFVKGELHIYHDRSYVTATNWPTFDVQLKNLQQSESKPLPGTNDSRDRFVRTTYYLHHLPEPTSVSEAISEIMSVINNDAQPYHLKTSEDPSDSHTIWHTVSDLTHHMYYFQSANNDMGLMWVNLDSPKLHLEEGAPAMVLNVSLHPEYVGDVTDQFVKQ